MVYTFDRVECLNACFCSLYCVNIYFSVDSTHFQILVCGALQTSAILFALNVNTIFSLDFANNSIQSFSAIFFTNFTPFGNLPSLVGLKEDTDCGK